MTDTLHLPKEHPSETFMRIEWVFRLNKADALLTLKALGGRLKPAEVEKAKELGDRLTILRAKAAEENLRGYIDAAKYVTSQEVAPVIPGAEETAP